uniref:polynucleotide adenylyltransferase n=1 Tax=Trypanosoma congolense (strain IL3000) TaxID=1068625 RepID=G0UK72_TRYCI|nr:putative polynucleotide adenylyltransferase [Trypanosoma congolense IL3000]
MSVDVVFISVALSQPPTSDQLLDDSFLLQVARDTRPSVNGIRFTFEVRRRLPVPHKVFATVLKAVKFWAMRRQVYGNIYTYPNGAVFAIMVARVCQVLPSPYPSVLLRFFFLFYTQWMSRHDHISPVYLTATLESRGRIPGLPESWKPAKNECFRDLFPVISPAYPYVNDASNVGRCGLESLYSEITQAQRVISASDTLSLEKLWRPYCIMEDFAHFLLVEVSSLGDDMADAERILGRWGSYVGSKLRFLIYSVERFVHARPHPHKLRAKMDGTFVDRKVCCSSIYFLIGVRSKNSGSSLRRCMFDEATDEFIYALQDGCSTENQSRSFHRDERKMHWPQVKLIGTSEISSFVDGL